MFRQLNNYNNLDVKLELWKTKGNPIANIPIDWCKNVDYTFGEPTQMNLEIPKYIMRAGEKVLNNLYNKIKIRQQILLTVNGKQERFIITEQSFKLEKTKGVKSLVAYSFEKTLENKRINFLDTVTRTLVKDDLYVHDGLLDEVIKVCSDWKIGYVDEDAKLITEMANETMTIDLFSNFTNSKVLESGLIFEKDVRTDVDSEHAVKITIDYFNLKTYDENGMLLKTENISNELSSLYTNITKIQAYHYSEVGNRYGIRYVMTLDDGNTMEQTMVFTNVVNKKITCEIKLVYETGKIVEGTRAKFITVDATNDNVLSFMKILQEEFECVFQYDTINKIINCYAKKNIGEDKPILLSYDSNMISVDVKHSDEVPNVLLVNSSNNVSIADVNPHGGEYVYNYKWYIENGFFEEDLINSLNKYDEILEVKQQEYNVLKRSMNDLYSKKTKFDSEVYSLENRIKYYNNLLVGFISAGSSDPQQATLKNEINNLESRLNECIRERNHIQEQILLIEDDMLNISKEVVRENVKDNNGNNLFTTDMLELLKELEYVVVYDDSYYTTSYGLYNNALKVFEEKLKPQAEFTVSCANLVKLIRGKLNNIIQLGSFFMVDTNDVDGLIEEKVRLIGYKLIPSEKKISDLLFSNKEFKKNKLNYASNIGQKVNKSTSTISTWQQVWEDAMLSNDYVSKLVEGGLNLATTKVNAKTDRNILDFSEYGSFWKDADDPTNGNQIYIGSSLIAISTDGFKTSSVAISGDGVIAQTVIGKLLLGSRVEITNDNMQFVIGYNEDQTRTGVHVKDEVLRDRIFLGLERQADGSQLAKLELKDPQGREVVISEKGIISHNQYQMADNMDASHPMYCYYTVDDGVYEIRKVKLFLKLEKYRAFEKGMASGGSVQTSSSGGAYVQSTSTADGGYYSETTTKTSNHCGYFAQDVDTKVVLAGQFSYDNVDTSSGSFHTSKVNHYHTVEIPLISHTHDVDVTVTVPNHSHGYSLNIPNHEHTLDTTHSHNLSYGIYEDSKPTNVAVYVNGNLVVSGINDDREIDVTGFMQLNKTNEIKITSATNGRIVCNVFSKTFVGY